MPLQIAQQHQRHLARQERALRELEHLVMGDLVDLARQFVERDIAVEEMGALLGCEDGVFWLGLHEPDEAGASASYAEVRRRCDASPGNDQSPGSAV